MVIHPDGFDEIREDFVEVRTEFLNQLLNLLLEMETIYAWLRDQGHVCEYVKAPRTNIHSHFLFFGLGTRA